MNKPLLAILCAAVTLSGCATQSDVSDADMQMRQEAVAKTDHLIVPGQRVGPVRLGMGMDEVLATLGKPDWSYINPGDYTKIDTEMGYNSLDLLIYFTTGAAPTVSVIEVRANTKESMLVGEIHWSDLMPVNDVFKTNRGFGLGASSYDVSRAYGSYDSLPAAAGSNMLYKRIGLLFLVTQDFRIYTIQVRSPE